MRVGIVVNPKKTRPVDKVLAVVKQLRESGAETLFDPGAAAMLNETGVAIETMHADVLVVFGGDGTILHTLQHTTVPLLPINSGDLGFLTEVGLDGAQLAVKRLLAGELVEEQHIRLAVELNGKRLEDCTNEAVLHTAAVSKMREYEITVNGVLAQWVRADGVIMSTPTGTTCYLMSVGGPILDPKVEAFALAPIAPFKLGSRPLVVPASAAVQMRQRNPDIKSLLVLDGQVQYEITATDIVAFRKSERPARFFRFQSNFYQRVRDKLATLDR